jgi:hypothetical protein
MKEGYPVPHLQFFHATLHSQLTRVQEFWSPEGDPLVLQSDTNTMSYFEL